MRIHGVPEDRVRGQIRIFETGLRHTLLERPAKLNDGIIRLSEAERESLAQTFDQAAAAGRAGEFVPASGAATRMFKSLLAVYARPESTAFSTLAKEAEKGGDAKDFLTFFQNVNHFAFHVRLREALGRMGHNLDALVAAKEFRLILQCLLTSQGLGYANLPKALIPFHLYPPGLNPTGFYPAGPRTALEEHLAESQELVRDAQGFCRLHFTVSAEHEDMIMALLETVRGRWEKDGARFEIGLSQQRRASDTLAVDEGNRPCRNTDGSLVFRPGGHGALLENLHHTGGDLVFIKNIDNLVSVRHRPMVLSWRKALGGTLVRLQERVFAYLKRLRESDEPYLTEEIAHFAEQRLGLILPEPMREAASDARAAAAKKAFLLKSLDRPIRVCGMVKNQGEPGGGPFWVRSADGSQRLQIVEAAQVNTAVSQQRKILEASTHFNPVDLVCGLRNARGELFKLQDFVDPEAYFITSKGKDGTMVKALELPGLWNGSMANWNTSFVELPVEAFSPVKTVNDLLRPSHQEQ